MWLHDNCEPKEGGDEGRGDEGGGHGVGVMWEYGVGGGEGASRGALIRQRAHYNPHSPLGLVARLEEEQEEQKEQKEQEGAVAWKRRFSL